MDDELMEWADNASDALRMAGMEVLTMDSDGTLTITSEDGEITWVGTMVRVDR